MLIDDMIDTGGTIAGAVRVLKEGGAGDVIIATTHGVFSHPAAERLATCGAKEVIATDTLPIPEDKRFENLTVLSIAPAAGADDPGSVRERFGDQPFNGSA